MSSLGRILVVSLVSLLVVSASPFGHRAPSASHHLIVVKIILRGGPLPYTFTPSDIMVRQGDTLRFVNETAVLHNVQFTRVPPGAKLGALATSPHLTAKGQPYTIVIDHRFAAGTYTYVCCSHTALGMVGVIRVRA